MRKVFLFLIFLFLALSSFTLVSNAQNATESEDEHYEYLSEEIDDSDVVTRFEPSTKGEIPNNPTAIENEKEGTDAWILKVGGYRSSDDANNQIKGYANKTSVNKGGSIDFKVTVNPAQNFTMEVYTGRPEQVMIGTMYGRNLGTHANNLPWTVLNENHWIYEGTGLRNGDKIPNVYGYEYNTIYSGYPKANGGDYTVLSRTNSSPDAVSTLYKAPSGALVFSAGTTDWPWLLDTRKDFNFENAKAKRITKNILDRFIGITITPTPTPSPTPTPTP